MALWTFTFALNGNVQATPLNFNFNPKNWIKNTFYYWFLIISLWKRMSKMKVNFFFCKKVCLMDLICLLCWQTLHACRCVPECQLFSIAGSLGSCRSLSLFLIPSAVYISMLSCFWLQCLNFCFNVARRLCMCITTCLNSDVLILFMTKLDLFLSGNLSKFFFFFNESSSNVKKKAFCKTGESATLNWIFHLYSVFLSVFPKQHCLLFLVSVQPLKPPLSAVVNVLFHSHFWPGMLITGATDCWSSHADKIIIFTCTVFQCSVMWMQNVQSFQIVFWKTKVNWGFFFLNCFY